MFFDISLNRRFIVFKSKFSTNSHNSLYLSWFDSLKLEGVNIKILLLLHPCSISNFFLYVSKSLSLYAKTTIWSVGFVSAARWVIFAICSCTPRMGRRTASSWFQFLKLRPRMTSQISNRLPVMTSLRPCVRHPSCLGSYRIIPAAFF